MKCFIYLNHYSNWCFILLVHCQSLRKPSWFPAGIEHISVEGYFADAANKAPKLESGPECWSWADQWWPLLAAAGCCWHHHRTFLGDPPTLGLRRGWGRWGKKRTWFTGIVASLRTLPLDIYCRPPHGGAREDTIDINKSIIEVEQLQLYMNVTTAWLCRYLDITERLLNLTL